MHNPSNVLRIATWEFRRFFRLRDLAILTLSLLGSVAVGGITAGYVRAASSKPVRVAVIHHDLLPVATAAASRVQLQSETRDRADALRQEIGRKQLDGLLIIHSARDAELLVRKSPPWRAELEQAVTAARRQMRLSDAGLSEADVHYINEPLPLRVSIHESGSPSSVAERYAALLFIGFLFLGLVLSFSFHFEAITGEKQARVTEVILSAIHPHDWMDGKIAGIAATGLATVLCYAALAAISAIGVRAAGVPLPMVGGAMNPGRIVMFLTLAILALVMWNCFFAAIAAMINEPTSSSRGTLMSFPITVWLIAVPVLGNPDTTVSKIMSYIPLTSYVVLPVRLVMSEVAWWEFPLAVTLLLAAIWVLRRLAGQIFSAGMMMTGKQLTPSDAWRWLRGATA